MVIAGLVLSGGIFDILSYKELKVIPVDVYVPGCPPDQSKFR
jgi:NADH:ubiquinone oxidoreductase subunit B-like Fe-S oxidoreductase